MDTFTASTTYLTVDGRTVLDTKAAPPLETKSGTTSPADAEIIRCALAYGRAKSAADRRRVLELLTAEPMHGGRR
jgi:hypothetical protein